MAKKGYRGKHPNNDNKVSASPTTSKYSAKLEKEYRSLKNDKTRYDYIRTHYFYPQSTCTLTVNGDVAVGENIIITSTDGKQVEYKAAGTEDTAANEFLRNGNNSGSLIDCINNSAGHGGKIFAELSSHTNILLTQIEPGPDGDTSVSGSSVNVTASNQSADQISVNGSFSF